MALTTGNLGGLNSVLSIATDNQPTGVNAGAVGINVSGTFVGTLTFQGSFDNTNYFAIAAYGTSINSGLWTPPFTTTTVAGQFVCPVYGYASVRVQMTAFTSGAAVVSVDSASSAPFAVTAVSTEGLKPSYFGSLAPLATASAATDIACLIGSATRTIRVAQVTFSMTQTTAAAYFDVQLIKRSGGTESAVNTAWSSANSGPFDSNDPALTAGGGGFTANPASLGTSVGVVGSNRYFAALTGTAAPTTQVVWTMGVNVRQVVLRGVSQLLALSLNTGAANVGVADITFWWSEE